MPTQLIRLQLIEGDPEGLRTASIAGRTTMVLACPWTDIKALLGREEAKRPAVYVLVGLPAADAATALGQVIYIGECDSLADRFKGNHHKHDAAEWVEIFLATTSDGTFNKAHARLAEHLLVKLARDTKRATVLNGGTTTGKLDEGDQAFAQEFASNVSTLAQTLGLGVFRAPIVMSSMPDAGPVEGAHEAPEFKFKYTNYPVAATMVPSGKEFVIKAGSLARATDMAGLGDGYRALRAKARKDGVLVPTDKVDYERFATDFPTSSASAAGAMIYGSACAGPVAWYHVKTNQSYKDWQAAQSGQKE